MSLLDAIVILTYIDLYTKILLYHRFKDLVSIQ